jgi:hypothetical protein
MPFGLPGYRNCGTESTPFAVHEVGLFWAIGTAHQRREYAGEAAAALIAFGFDVLHLARKVATADTSNAASAAVMVHLGMCVEPDRGRACTALSGARVTIDPDRTGMAPDQLAASM